MNKSLLNILLISGGVILSLYALGMHYRNEIYDAAMQFERGKAGFVVKQVDLTGKPIVYMETKPKADQETILLLHGFGATKENWLRFAVPFAENNYHVVALDLPGHGESTKDMALNYSIDSQVGYLKEFTSALGLKKFHLAGNSMGGAISAMYTSAHPEQVLSLTLIDPAGVHIHRSEFQEQLDEGKNPLIVQKPEDFKALVNFAMEQPPFIPWPVSLVAAEKTMARQKISAKIFNDLTTSFDSGFVDRLHQIKTPTLIMWGAKDRVIDVENINEYSAYIPDSKKKVFDDVGHTPMIEIPFRSAGAMLEFAQAVRSHSKTL